MRKDVYDSLHKYQSSHWLLRCKFDLFASYVKRYVPRPLPEIIDIGCGTGGLLDTVRDSAVAVGVDYLEYAVRICRGDGHTRCAVGSAMTLPFSDASFDAAFMADVLYHRGITDKLGAIQEARRVLRSGGILVASFPAYAWLYSSADAIMEGDKRFVRSEIVALAKASDMCILRCTYWNTFLFPAALAVRIKEQWSAGDTANLEMGGSGIVNAICSRVLMAELALLKYVNMPFGLSIVLVAQKS